MYRCVQVYSIYVHCIKLRSRMVENEQEVGWFFSRRPRSPREGVGLLNLQCNAPTRCTTLYIYVYGATVHPRYTFFFFPKDHILHGISL